MGATIGGIPYILVAFFQGWPIGVAAIVFLIVYQQIENNVFQPVIHRYTVQLNPLWIILAVLVGATVLGFIGALMAIPIAGIVQVLLQEWWAWRQEQRTAAARCHRASSRPRSRRRPTPSPDEGAARGYPPGRGPAKRRAARAAGRPRAAGGPDRPSRAAASSPSRWRRRPTRARSPAARPRPRRRCACATWASAGPAAPPTCAPATAAAARDAALEAEALAEVLATVRIWLEAREAVAGHGEEAPRLAAALAAPDVGAARRVEAALERALDPRGGLLDTASPELASCAAPPGRGPARGRRPAARPSPPGSAPTCRSRSPPSAAAARCWR